jgi:hypothetical protein
MSLEDEGVEMSEVYASGRSTIVMPTLSPAQEGLGGRKGQDKRVTRPRLQPKSQPGVAQACVWALPALLLLGALIGGVIGIAALIFACEWTVDGSPRVASRLNLDLGRAFASHAGSGARYDTAGRQDDAG